MGQIIPFRQPTSEHHYICFECGADYRWKSDLQAHWDSEHHGPRHVQLDALDRAQASIGTVFVDAEGN